MESHHGRIVELTIRKKGLNISEIARLTHVNRRSVYNWFNQKYLKPEIIYRLGLVLKHDFSIEFPDLFSKQDFFKDPKTINDTDDTDLVSEEVPGNHIWKDRYISLLENYNKLLLSYAQRENSLRGIIKE
jgi:transcriptional regulator with XRE-family HTH domain